ncbi:conserved domain protein [Actinomyces sp. oral taxon 175 str. F0384]|nr:conserved domain protein [Actinomyces sp. oral taxon 175 str. F0384]
MSTSDTKARNGPTLTKEKRMIPRFTWTSKERWRSFVTDLDILARDRLR